MQLIINNLKYTDNSNEVDENSIFVLSKQNERFKQSAIENGAKAIIEASELKEHLDMSSIKIIGITGTNGKTTTAATIYSIFLSLGFKVALQGTRGFFINETQIQEYSLTTPVQLGNFANIQKAIQNDCDFFVMEVSSHAIEQKRVQGLDFALKIHTNITRDHLDYHKTIQEYIDVKNSFLSDDSVKLVNIDDKNLQYNSKNAFTYSLQKEADFKVLDYNISDKTEVKFTFENKDYKYISLMMGIFNIYNTIASIGAVHILTQKPLEEICQTLKNFDCVSGRMEIVSVKPLVIVDFAHTPDGMEEVLKSFLNHNIICVFGAGGNRDKHKRPLMGKVAQKYSKHIIITSDNPRFEEPEDIINDILDGIDDKSNVKVFVNRKVAIKEAINLADEKSVVLVLGKGDEAYHTVKDEKIPYSDKEEIKKILEII